MAEAEAAAAEAAAIFENGDLFGGVGGGVGDGGGDTPDSSQANGQVIDVVAAAGNGHGGSSMSPSRESMSSNMAKYALRNGAGGGGNGGNGRGSDMFRSYDTGVDQPTSSHHPLHQHHHHHHHSDADNQDHISIQSASGAVYRSIDSLNAGNNGGRMGGGGNIPGGNSTAGGASSGKGSLPTSPFVRRASKSNSFSSHVRLHEKFGGNAAGTGKDGKKPLVLLTYLDAQEHLPYADDSTAVTPKSELNGLVVVDTPTRMNLARKYSYTSHTGKVDSYNSHTDLQYHPSNSGRDAGCGAAAATKENTLRKRMASLFSDMGRSNSTVTTASEVGALPYHGGGYHRPSAPNSILLEQISSNPYPGGNGNGHSGTIGAPESPHKSGEGGGFANNGKEPYDIQVGAEKVCSPLLLLFPFTSFHFTYMSSLPLFLFLFPFFGL